MNIIRTAPVAFCPDGSDTIEFLLGSAVPQSLIEYLVSMGRTEYFPRFARPFFRISRSGSFIVKGLVAMPLSGYPISVPRSIPNRQLYFGS